MLTDKTDPQANQLSAEEQKPLEENERLLETAVAQGSIKDLAALIKQGASVNIKHIYTSLLATAIMNKKSEMVRYLLKFSYLITESDIEEVRVLIAELKAIKASGELDEKNKADLNTGLAVLCALMQDHPHKIVNDKILGLKAEINAAIITLSLPSATATTTTVASVPPQPLLHAFQPVNATDAATDGTNKLFSLIASQEFNEFRDWLKLLITNPAFNINAIDNEKKTLLHHASINPDNRFLKILLENKANPNIGDKYGWTPVHLAALTGNNFNAFMESSTFVPIDWNAKTHLNEKTQRQKTILQLAIQGKKIPESGLNFIRSKISNTTESNSPSLH